MLRAAPWRGSSVTILLYRPSLDFSSGAGQLMRMQLRALRDAGEPAEIGCERGALKFWLRSGARARRIPLRAVRDAGGCTLRRRPWPLRPKAAVVFVHNLATEASVHLPGRIGQRRRTRNGAFSPICERTRCSSRTRGSSGRRAVSRGSARAPERVVVQHPGYRAASFQSEPRRRATRVGATRARTSRRDAPLVGLITSGDFEKRGLDVFVGVAERDHGRGAPDARFLVVGSKSLPKRFACTIWSQAAGCCIGRRAALRNAGSRPWISSCTRRASRSSGWSSWRRRRSVCRF